MKWLFCSEQNKENCLYPAGISPLDTYERWSNVEFWRCFNDKISHCFNVEMLLKSIWKYVAVMLKISQNLQGILNLNLPSKWITISPNILTLVSHEMLNRGFLNNIFDSRVDASLIAFDKTFFRWYCSPAIIHSNRSSVVILPVSIALVRWLS